MDAKAFPLSSHKSGVPIAAIQLDAQPPLLNAASVQLLLGVQLPPSKFPLNIGIGGTQSEGGWALTTFKLNKQNKRERERVREVQTLLHFSPNRLIVFLMLEKI
jgi:hypothetical protein